jgi:hypothetical protein
LAIVADLLTTVVGTDSSRNALIKEGADSRYQAAPSELFGSTTPLIQVTGVGDTPAEATLTANLVGKALATAMASLQSQQSVNSRYWIKTLEVTPPNTPQPELSSKLRELIGVLAIGAILMFVVVSVLRALEERRLRKWSLERQAHAHRAKRADGVDAGSTKSRDIVAPQAANAEYADQAKV